MPLSQRVAALGFILSAFVASGEPAPKSKTVKNTPKATTQKPVAPYKTAVVTMDLRPGEKSCRQQTIRIDPMQHSIIGGYNHSATLPAGLSFEATKVSHSHEEMKLGQSESTVTTGSALVIDYCITASSTLAPATYTGEGKVELTIASGISIGSPATLQFKVTVAGDAHSVPGQPAVSPARSVAAAPPPPTVPAQPTPRTTAPTGPRIPSRPSPAPSTDLFGVPRKPVKPEVHRVKGDATELAGMNEFSISVMANEAGLRNEILQIIRRELPHLVFHAESDDLDDTVLARTIMLRFAGAGKTNRLWVFRSRGLELRTLAEIDAALSPEESAKDVAERFVKLYRKHNPDWRNRTPVQSAPVTEVAASEAPIRSVGGLREVIGDPQEMRAKRSYFFVSKDPEVLAAFNRVVAKGLPQLTPTDANAPVSSETLCITVRKLSGKEAHDKVLGEIFRVTGTERRILTTARLDSRRGKTNLAEDLARLFVRAYREANR
jgi:hypothetical protein